MAMALKQQKRVTLFRKPLRNKALLGVRGLYGLFETLGRLSVGMYTF